jgi:broad specificity phosphatase PhoE
MRLYLVRHGQTSWNNEGRVQGHCDLELDETGQRQAGEVALALKGLPVERLLTSDLCRCSQTAAAIARALGLEPEVRPALRERHFGALEGTHYEIVRATIETAARERGGDPFDERPESGESLRDVWDRVAPVVEELQAESRPTVVVSHGGAIGLMLARLIGAEPVVARAFRFANASLTELSRRGDGSWAIDRLNDKSHLEVAREGFGTGA